jgi:hypothetical protein
MSRDETNFFPLVDKIVDLASDFLFSGDNGSPSRGYATALAADPGRCGYWMPPGGRGRPRRGRGGAPQRPGRRRGAPPGLRGSHARGGFPRRPGSLRASRGGNAACLARPVIPGRAGQPRGRDRPAASAVRRGAPVLAKPSHPAVLEGADREPGTAGRKPTPPACAARTPPTPPAAATPRRITPSRTAGHRREIPAYNGCARHVVTIRPDGATSATASPG